MRTLLGKTFGFALLLLVLLALAPGSGYCQGARVAVFPFKNNGQPQYNGLASGIAAMFTTDLTKAAQLDVVDPQKVAASIARARLAGAAPSVDDALKAAASLEADYAVTGEFVVFGNRFRIDVRLYDVRGDALKAAEKAQAKEDALFEAVDELSSKVILAITGAIPAAGGALVVSSEPPRARLTVDGDKAGETPATLKDLPAGLHKVELELDGYKPYSETVSVRGDETTRVDVKLVRLYGGIRLWWKMGPDSDVGIAGETVKTSHFQYNLFAKYCRNLPSGTYTVTARMPYKDEAAWESTRTWRTYTADVDVRPGEVVDIFINNNLYSPRIETNTCGSCAPTWDFNTDIVWYETQ